jgi:hypothetical protein
MPERQRWEVGQNLTCSRESRSVYKRALSVTRSCSFVDTSALALFELQEIAARFLRYLIRIDANEFEQSTGMLPLELERNKVVAF